MPLPIVLYGDPILRRKADPIGEMTPEIHQLIEQMLETMVHENGVGLAAPQVGHSLRLFVLRDEITDESGEFCFSPPEVVINPEFSDPSDELQIDLEGCLSIPKIQVEVARPLKIHVRYQNLKGESISELLEGFRARVFMHENDHLNGRLMIDRVQSDVIRKRLAPALQKIKNRSK
ncbi:MAG: peptide deformylase [Chlamydiales bacterium]|nr:peptide deformylase [Chlamydiales bacterium]